MVERAFMNRAFASSLFVVLVACGGGRPTTAVAPASLHVRVLATHDFHGALRPTTYIWSEGRPVGGAVAMKAVMNRLEADCVCPTVRLDGGDQMQGTLESNLTMGASAVAVLNAIGLDAAAVGNHELDWGVDTLRARQREAYTLATNDFLADGGDGLMVLTTLPRDVVGVSLLDAVIAHLRK
jgi:2',3'-cyclic-nucleotide 2'-phosphodiesterase (5'-nucleotidase family)